ncbi:DUF1269 domain-containing protein [Actinomyces israelii]
MTAHNFVIVGFEESANAYKALSVLRGAAAEGRITIAAAVIGERGADGSLRLAEGEDAVIGGATVGGGLIGMAVGILGGPLGMLLGWGAGSLIGGFADADRVDRSETAIGELSRRLPAGTTAILAEVEEYATEVLDGVVSPLGGQVLRLEADQVLGELEAAEAAAIAADREAARVLHQERKQKWEDRVDSLREKLHRKK